MRVALFGGSFDPVHQGHLVGAGLLRQMEHLGRIVFVPAAGAPHKQRTAASAAERLAMLRLAVRGHAAFRISTVELRRPAPSYTIDTVRAFRRTHGTRPWLLLGGDALLELHTWREWRALLDAVQLAVAVRPGAPPDSPFTADAEVATRPFVRLPLPPMAVSASDIRARVAAGQDISALVPPEVARYIEINGLYRAPAGS